MRSLRRTVRADLIGLLEGDDYGPVRHSLHVIGLALYAEPALLRGRRDLWWHVGRRRGRRRWRRRLTRPDTPCSTIEPVRV